MGTPKGQEAIKRFFEEAGEAIKRLGQKMLQVQISLREKLPIIAEDVAEMSQASQAVAVAASTTGLAKTLRLSRQMTTLFDSLRPRPEPFDEKTVELANAAFEALRSLVKDLQEKGRELADIAAVEEGLKDFLKSQTAVSEKGVEKSGEKIFSSGIEIDEKYLDVFLDDAEQNMEHFNEGLVSLEKNPTDAELINTLFRVIHTIKGSSAMVNISNIQEVAHAMESILALAREKKQAFADMFSLLFSGIDMVAGLVFSLRRKEPSVVDIAPLVTRLKKYAAGHSSQKKLEKTIVPAPPQEDILQRAAGSREARELLAQAVARKSDVYQIDLILEEGTSLKGMKAMLVEERLKGKGTVILMNPTPEEIDEVRPAAVPLRILFGTVIKSEEIIPLLSVSEVKVQGLEAIKAKTIRALLEQQPDLVSFPQGQKGSQPHKEIVAESHAGASAATSIRIDAHKLDALMNLSGELVTVRAQFERLVSLLNGEIVSQREFFRVIGSLKSYFSALGRDLALVLEKSQGPESERILRQLEFLNARLEELAQSVSRSDLAGEVRLVDETTGTLGKIASYIQAAVMQARMVPIKGVFSRFSRIVRDIAKDLGKDVTLVIEGEETELDKNLVDAIGEPLIHMVRNAIDHGIEDEAVRRKAGKSPRGTISLRAFHEGNNVCVEVSDDGRGIDPDVLAYNALKKKLISEEQASRLSSREKLDLMFLPGFSTAARVTGVSGRGVGMDIVRNMIASINGTVDINSRVGAGTTFILKIPLTLAIIQALLVAIDGETYAMPLEAVTEILKVTDDMIHSIDGNATVKLRDEVLSIIELRDVIHTRGTPRPDEGIKRVMVISDGETQVGIFVDRTLGETEIVIKALSYHFFHVKGISGGTILGDGKVALILDPKLIMMECR